MRRRPIHFAFLSCFLFLPVLILSSCGESEPPKAVALPGMTKLWDFDSVNALGFSLIGDTAFSQEFAKTGNYTGQLVAYDLTKQQVGFRQAYTEPTTDGATLARRGDDYNSQEVVGSSDGFIARYLDGKGPAIQAFDHQGKRIKIVRQPDTDDSYFELQKITLSGDLVLVATLYHLYAYSLKDLLNAGTTSIPLWQKDYLATRDGYYNLSAVQVDAATGMIYTLSYDKKDPSDKHLFLNAIKPDGMNLWQKEVKTTTIGGAGMTASGGTIVVFPRDSFMTRYDADGNVIWKKSNLCSPNGDYGIQYAQISGNGNTLLDSPGGNAELCAFNLDDGSRKWTFDSQGAGFINKFALVNGVLYACNGRLYAIDSETGSVLAQQGVDAAAELGGGTVLYDAPRNQLLIWASKLWAYRPIR